MSARAALRAAFVDFYENSWRLATVNAVLGAALVAVAAAAFYVPAALLLVVLLGPLAAALMHVAVVLARTESVRIRDGLDGLRLHWRRGLALGTAGAATLALGLFAVHFYSGGGTALWPLSFVVLYVLVLLGLYQLVLWTLAIAEPELRLRDAAARAAELIARAPRAALGLGLALVVVNAAGVAAAAMPFLTLTVGYSFLAAAHFAFPRPTTLPEA